MKIFKADENNEKISFYAFVSALYFICMPLSIVPIPGGISLLKLLSIFSGAALISALFLGEEKKIQFNMVHFFLGLYIIYSIASLFVLYDENSWINLRGILETSALLYLISIKVYNQREKRLFVNAWLVAGIITVLTMFSGGVELGTSERFTIGIGGGNEDPNQLCGYFFAPILICMDRATKKSKLRILYIFLMLAMIYVAFTTGSRGGLAAVFATIAAYVFLAVKGVSSRLKVLVIMVLVFAVFSTVLFPILPDSVKERMKIESVIEDKGSGRFDLWKTVYSAITDSYTSLVFGYGLGSTQYFLQESSTHSTVAHNHWLQVWCDQGAIGLLLFFAVIFSGWLRSMANSKIIAVSLFGMLVLSLSLTLYASYKPFWNILMMSAMNYEGVDDSAK